MCLKRVQNVQYRCVSFIAKEEHVQASVGMGELGISLGDPDDWALDVLGDILNSFGGRLFDRIRSREVWMCPPWLVSILHFKS